MTYASAGNVRLYYEEVGHGHPIVFVHEFGADHREWELQLRFFSRAYRCIAYAARGYPPSDVPADPALYGYEFSADDIAAVMDSLKIERAHVVGLSMGAYAALQFGIRHPGRATAIVAAGVGTGSAPHQRSAFLEEAPRTAAGFPERGMAAMTAEMGESPTRRQLRAKNPRAFAQWSANVAGHSPEGMSLTMARYQALRPSLHDFTEAWGRMETPVLLAVGDEDGPCLSTNLMLKAAIPTAGLWVCPNTGHAINLEEPEAFNLALQDFFGAAERGTWPTHPVGYPAW